MTLLTIQLLIFHTVTVTNTIHEKITDWLRAVQFKFNTGAKSVTAVQITLRNSGL